MKRLLLAGLLAGVAFSASAQSVGVAVQPTVQDDIHSDIATRDVRDHTCLRETGSLITTAQNQRALITELKVEGEDAFRDFVLRGVR